MSALLQDYATRVATPSPSKVALVMADERVTHGELEAESNRLARLVREHGCRQGDRVCLFDQKSPRAIVAMHAVLKAGATYVPIDLASPAPRIAKIVEATGPRLVLATQPAAPVIDELLNAGRLDAGIGLLEAPADGQRLPAACDPTDWRALPSEPLDPSS